MDNPNFISEEQNTENPKDICYLELEDRRVSTNGLNGAKAVTAGRRRSNAFSFSGESEDNEESDDHKKESLIATTLQVLKHKDFVNEFRSKRDIDLFVSDSRVLIDCNELDLEAIVNKMLSVRLVLCLV